MPPRLHFRTETTRDKLCQVLDQADDQGLEVVLIDFIGGRDYLVVTRPGPIMGPAGRRVFTPREE